MATAGDVVEEDLGRMNRPPGSHRRNPAAVVGREDNVGALQPGESLRPWVLSTPGQNPESRNLTVGPREGQAVNCLASEFRYQE
jgi:hypothetical protein